MHLNREQRFISFHRINNSNPYTVVGISFFEFICISEVILFYWNCFDARDVKTKVKLKFGFSINKATKSKITNENLIVQKDTIYNIKKEKSTEKIKKAQLQWHYMKIRLFISQ